MNAADRDETYPAAKVYCNSKLMRAVQTSPYRPVSDSKDIVDLELKLDPEDVLSRFESLPESPSREEYDNFMSEVFSSPSDDAMTNVKRSVPVDYTDEPPSFLKNLQHPNERLAKYVADLKNRWRDLCREFYPLESEPMPSMRSSLIRLDKPFFISGGRFRELYYWDTLWIAKGLVASDMMDSAKGAVRNLVQLVDEIGFVPNGNRVYYLNRSQPPIFTSAVRVVFQAMTSEKEQVEWLAEVLPAAEKEYTTFMKRHALCELYPDGPYANTPLAVYRADTEEPRPESYKEDATSSKLLMDKLPEGEDPDQRAKDLCRHLASAAESGWDFSSRWFSACGDGERLEDLRTCDIIPCCLNSILLKAEKDFDFFHHFLAKHSHYLPAENERDGSSLQGQALSESHEKRSKHYAGLALQRQASINELLWDGETGFWFDYDIKSKKRSSVVSCGGLFPLWAGCWDDSWGREEAARIAAFATKESGLVNPGGLSATTQTSEEQWDYPNCWPPLVDIAVEGLMRLGRDFPGCGADATCVANRFLESSYNGWVRDKVMHEKYDCRDNEGRRGEGGEYAPQTGFGWTNGTILYLMSEHPHSLETLSKTIQGESTC